MADRSRRLVRRFGTTHRFRSSGSGVYVVITPPNGWPVTRTYTDSTGQQHRYMVRIEHRPARRAPQGHGRGWYAFGPGREHGSHWHPTAAEAAQTLARMLHEAPG